MELTIGCTTRPFAKLPYGEACERIADAGYTDVALFINDGEVPVRSDSTPEEVAGVRETVEETGLRPSMLLARSNLDLGLEAALEEYQKLISNASQLGCRWLLDCGTSREEHYENYYEMMRRAMPRAEECGVKVVIKPHGGITLTIDDLLKAHERVNHPSFGICYDPGNIIYYTRGELRPEVDIDRVAPVTCAGIVKDCIVVDGKPDVVVTPGEGLVDFEKVFAGLISGGFDGPLYVECVGGEEIEEIDRNIRGTLEFVKNILAGL